MNGSDEDESSAYSTSFYFSFFTRVVTSLGKAASVHSSIRPSIRGPLTENVDVYFHREADDASDKSLLGLVFNFLIKVLRIPFLFFHFLMFFFKNLLKFFSSLQIFSIKSGKSIFFFFPFFSSQFFLSCLRDFLPRSLSTFSIVVCAGAHAQNSFASGETPASFIHF